MKNSSSYFLAGGAIALIALAGAVMTSSVGVAQDEPAAVAQPGATIEGTVTDTVNVAGYTYVEVETADGSVWAAAPSVSIGVGDSVTFATNMPMRNFYSKSMQREFEVIYFVDRFISAHGTTSIDSDAAAAHGSTAGQGAAIAIKEIARADGGLTISEILSRGAELDGEQLTVRGQVVKFTPQVMNTNWIRIRDGSTDGELVIPTDSTVAIGDVVLASGTFVQNMDLGQGYVIAAVLDKAQVAVE